ncbi:MAG TPA: hypothetical protein VF116_08105 [Ktedonobacterales bacterium]
MSNASVEADRIDTAIGWAKQFPDKGVPDDIGPADATVKTHSVTHQVIESTGPYTWEEPEWTVVIRGQWAVDLDSRGVPKGPPYYI